MNRVATLLFSLMVPFAHAKTVTLPIGDSSIRFPVAAHGRAVQPGRMPAHAELEIGIERQRDVMVREADDLDAIDPLGAPLDRIGKRTLGMIT